MKTVVLLQIKRNVWWQGQQNHSQVPTECGAIKKSTINHILNMHKQGTNLCALPVFSVTLHFDFQNMQQPTFYLRYVIPSAATHCY